MCKVPIKPVTVYTYEHTNGMGLLLVVAVCDWFYRCIWWVFFGVLVAGDLVIAKMHFSTLINNSFQYSFSEVAFVLFCPVRFLQSHLFKKRWYLLTRMSIIRDVLVFRLAVLYEK